MPDEKESHLDVWLDDLKIFAKAFYNKICSKDEEFKEIVKYDEEDFKKVFNKYLDYRNKFNTIIKGDIIDRHKELASIILAATDEEDLIFKVNNEAIKNSTRSDFPYWVIHPNEYCLCKILLHILTDYVLITEKSKKYGLNKDNYNIRFPDRIIWWDKDIKQPYEEQFCQMLSFLIATDDIAIKCSLLASHLVCFYELAFDCVIKKELSKTYYDITV
jgi:hypothetical protein